MDFNQTFGSAMKGEKRETPFVDTKGYNKLAYESMIRNKEAVIRKLKKEIDVLKHLKLGCD